MKKLLLSALLAASVGFGASATDRVVYQDGQLGNYQAYDWYQSAFDFQAQDPADESVKVFSFKSATGGTGASMGINAEAAEVTTGPLHSATLNFDWYATTAGQKYTIRVTCVAEQNYEFTTTEENINKWNKVSLPVATTFPAVAQEWKEDKNEGAGYVFSVILDNGVAESVIYFNNIVYTGLDDAWVAPVKEQLPAPATVPVPTRDAANVISVYGNHYTAATTFGIGGWGQATAVQGVSVAGNDIMQIKRFNYLGWEFGQHLDVSSCNMMHVDFFAATEGNFGFTPISPGAEKAWIAPAVKVGEWNSYDVPLSHYDNVNFADIYQVKFDQGNGQQEGYIANVYFYKDGNVKDPELGGVWYGTVEGSCTKGETNYDITVDYVFTANEDGTLGIELTVDGDEGLDASHQVHIVSVGGGDEWVENFTQEGNVYSGKSANSYTAGQKFDHLEIYFPYAGGVFNSFVRDYVFGAQNEAPVAAPKLRLSASAANVTAHGAEINYSVKASSHFDGVDVKVTVNDVVVTENPYVLGDLDPKTEYSYIVKASAELDGETYESEPVTVKFTTLRDGAVAALYYAITDGVLNNAYLPGEDPATSRRSIPVSIEATLSYNPDQTMTVTAKFHGQQVVGFVPKVTLRGKYDRQPMTLVEGTTDTYTATTTTAADKLYEEGENFDYLYFNIAYDGGDSGNAPAINGYHAGDTNSPVAYGEAASIEFNLAKTVFSVSESTTLLAVVKDENGHYLLDESATYSVEGNGFAVEGNKLTATDKGTATVTAAYGEITATADVLCVVSASADNLFGENCTLESDHDNPGLAFDGNEGSQVEWADADGPEHYIVLDLGKLCTVEAIEMVWEGASAKVYTVTLSKDAETEGDVQPLAVGDVVTKVYEVTDGEGGAGLTPRKTLYNEDLTSNEARYVKLETKEASTGWGIKLKEMRVMGKEGTTLLVVDTAIDANTPVEYFNLQGMRVANPAAGNVYIRRQGTEVSKVVL